LIIAVPLCGQSRRSALAQVTTVRLLVTLKEYRQTKDKRERLTQRRRDCFVSSGFRPLQAVLCLGVFAYVFSMIGAVWYYWPRLHLSHALVLSAIIIFFWKSHFLYRRQDFWLLVFVAGGSLLGSLANVDFFHVVCWIGLLVVMVAGTLLYTKMKDPIFSNVKNVDGA
jgi:hypothetical protein